MKYKQIELSNGAILRYTKNNINTITSTEIMFDCGARCDTIPGLAHFTEHMFFSGTDTMTKEEISKKYFDFINVNAYTSPNYIVFAGDVFTKEFGEYLSTVKDMITKSTFKQSAVDKEIPVVQQEIARNNDNFRRKANEFNNYSLTHMKYFKDEVLGSNESVGSIKSKDVKDFVKKYFVAQNAEIYVVSPLPFAKVKKLVEKNLVMHLPSNKKFAKLPLYSDYVVDNTFYEVKQQDIDKCYLNINFVVIKLIQILNLNANLL
ncbi:MAG: insulinase family protein [Clostridia bacterium]|nr:insulinase family protein [Clostridia bacterium]